SLGRLWIEMHPDSQLREQLDYLVPLEGELPRPEMRPVKEITFLDPASGTMHFGLVAYDMFAAMYRDELANTGKPGWPILSSVTSEDEIPAAIIANNLFGIDIDLRAVQLSALVLYIRAKTDNPKAVVRDTNLACADVLPPKETALDAFLIKSGLERPMYAHLIKSLWTNLK